jgi:hypothetical protein
MSVETDYIIPNKIVFGVEVGVEVDSLKTLIFQTAD